MFNRLGLPMNHYTISFFFQKTKTLSLALPTSNSSLYCTNSRIETARHLVQSDFLKRSTQNFEIRRRVPRVKKLTKIKKNTHTHTHTHTFLYLSIRRCNVYLDVPAPVSPPLSLSLSLSPYICKHGLDPDQTRMVFRIECFVLLKMCACDRKYAKR